MAQFNADILLAVRGSEKARKEIERLEAALDKVGKKANLDLSGQVRLKGEQRLLKENVKNTVEYNKQLKISQEIARIASQRAKGLGQFASPIGPKQDRTAEIRKKAAQQRLQLAAKSAFQTKLELALARQLVGVEGQITKQQQAQIRSQQSLNKQKEKALALARREAKAKKGGGGGAGGGLAAGIGFPLLFGSGPGSVIGGALGSAGGFGTQILASAIGGIIDQAVAGVAKLGQALDPLTADIDAVVEAAGESGTAFGQLVKDLEKVAGKEKALEVATAQLATVIGQEGVSALKEFGDESAELGRVYAETLSQIGAAVAGLINSSGFLIALARRLERTNLVNVGVRNETKDPELTDLNQEYRRAQRGKGERSFNEIADEIAARAKVLQLEQQTNIEKEAGADIAKINAAVSKDSLKITENALALSRINAGLENDKVFELRLQGIELTRNEEINQNILDLNNKQITRAQALTRQIAINSKAEADRNKLENDRKNAQDRLAEKAASDAKRLARDAEQAAKAEQRVLQQLEQSDLNRYKARIEGIRLAKGEEAAIRQQLSDFDALVAKRLRVLELSDKDVRLKQAEAALIRENADNERLSLRNALQRIALQRELNKLKAQQEIDAVQTGLDQELAGLSLGGNEQTDLLQKQGNRYANTLTDINNKIEQQNLLIENTPTPDQNAINAATTRLDVLKQTKAAYEAMLPQIFAAEQAQLKYNQAFAAITPAVNSLVGGLREVVAGTKTAEEAFADFLNTVADQLINTAATMIAQYIAIGIARAFAFGGNSGANGFNLSGGGSSVGSGGLPGIDSLAGLFTGSLPFVGSSTKLAEGGYVTGPTNALIGEAGESEYVIPSSKMNNAMANYSMGKRGGSILDDPAGSAESAAGGTSINMSFETTRFMDRDWVDKEQLLAAMSQTKQASVAEGQAKTFSTLRNSRSQRSKLGMSR